MKGVSALFEFIGDGYCAVLSLNHLQPVQRGLIAPR
jgi:hypothetical protein